MTEVGNQAYMMFGDQVKFDPAWVLEKSVKNQLQNLRVDDMITSTTGGLTKR